MTRLGIIANGDKETILRTISLLNTIEGLKIVYITQNETSNLYVVNELDYYRLKLRDGDFEK